MTDWDLHVSPGLAWSRVVGRFARLPLPAPVLRSVIASYGRLLHVEMSEMAIPDGGFTTFGQFFARGLAAEARITDCSPRALVAPCDGVVQAAGSWSRAATRVADLHVKGRSFSPRDLMGKEGWWSRGISGGYVVIYLSPADYHRVHSPIAGDVKRVRRLPGTCMPVNKLGQILAPWAIVRNERVVFELTTPDGPVAVVMVGALAVRAIEVSLPGFDNGSEEAPPVTVDRAQEIGVFNLGSTVVMLWQGDGQIDVQVGERVLFGQKVAQR